jgi:hypothetical protein
MLEWIENGCHLAWLISPVNQTTYIYQHGTEAKEVNSFNNILSGEEVLDGFVFALQSLM